MAIWNRAANTNGYGFFFVFFFFFIAFFVVVCFVVVVFVCFLFCFVFFVCFFGFFLLFFFLGGGRCCCCCFASDLQFSRHDEAHSLLQFMMAIPTAVARRCSLSIAMFDCVERGGQDKVTEQWSRAWNTVPVSVGSWSGIAQLVVCWARCPA